MKEYKKGERTVISIYGEKTEIIKNQEGLWETTKGQIISNTDPETYCIPVLGSGVGTYILHDEDIHIIQERQKKNGLLD